MWGFDTTIGTFFSKRRIKVFSAAVTFNFLVTTAARADLIAFPSNPPKPAETKAKIFSTQTLTVPDSFGSMERIHHDPNSNRFVVLIQDAHAVLDAQVNIQKLIEYFQKEYGIRTVLLEGTEGRLDPTLFRAFQDETLKKRVFQGYLGRGELTGAEMAAILNEQPADYFGIEDWELYEKDYIAYLKAFDQRPEALETLNEIERRLDEERARIYSTELNRFHEAVSGFRAGSLHFIEFLKFLGQFRATSTAKQCRFAGKTVIAPQGLSRSYGMKSINGIASVSEAISEL